jgi:hypothetical protein
MQRSVPSAPQIRLVRCRLHWRPSWLDLRSGYPVSALGRQRPRPPAIALALGALSLGALSLGVSASAY